MKDRRNPGSGKISAGKPVRPSEKQGSCPERKSANSPIAGKSIVPADDRRERNGEKFSVQIRPFLPAIPKPGEPRLTAADGTIPSSLFGKGGKRQIGRI
jgi:hypothetical protein